MHISQNLKLILLLSMGICWTIVYVLIIYRSFKDKTYGMPFTALALNISWEFIYAFVIIPTTKGIQTFVNRVWFLLDAVILITYILYGKKDWKNKELNWLFIPHLLFVLIVSSLLIYYMSFDFEVLSITYSAFLMNVVISALFITMLLNRKSIKGQSTGIAFFKLIGTLCATLILFDGFSVFLQLLGFTSFILDLVYLGMLLTAYKKEKISILTRKIVSL